MTSRNATQITASKATFEGGLCKIMAGSVTVVIRCCHSLLRVNLAIQLTFWTHALEEILMNARNTKTPDARHGVFGTTGLPHATRR
jgi:hypothetical protein